MILKIYFDCSEPKKIRGVSVKDMAKIANDLNSAKKFVSVGDNVIVRKKNLLCVLFCDD